MSAALLAPAAQGFGVGFGLILAIGSQNAFVLRQGLRRDRVFLVVAICGLGDAVFIMLGAGGVGTLVANTPWLQGGAVWFGSAFLIGYGGLAFRNALRGADYAGVDGGREVSDLKAVVAATLAFTFLNPHVYLDTIVVLGSIAGQLEGAERAAFAVGAVSASLVFFASLGYGAALAAPLFTRPTAWRLLDVTVGVVMWTVAVSLLAPRLLGT